VSRQRNNPREDSWRGKLYPIFFDVADVNSQFEKRWAQLQTDCRQELSTAGSDVSPEARNEIMARFMKGKAELESWIQEKLIDINSRYTPIPYDPVAYSYFTLDQPISDGEGIRQYLHFHRHGESLQASKTKDAQGDIDAWDRISRTERDSRILAYGKGPIAPFQEDVVHRQLLQSVICYERERLTAEQLAECFDRYCACGKANHDPDSLRKMRDRFEAELRGSMKSP
jgi:hypothetical protein